MTFPYYAVDLDGTLAHNSNTSNTLEIGLPVPLMLSRVLRWLKEGKEVRVVTARVNSEDNPHADKQRLVIEKWLQKYVGQKLPITCKKSHNMVELWDDRAVQIIPNTGERVLALEGQLLSSDPEDLHCSAHTYHMSGCAECYHKAIFASYIQEEKLEKAAKIIHNLEIVPSAPSPKIQMVKQQLHRKIYLFFYNAASDIAVALRKNHVKKAEEKKKDKELLLLAYAAINWEEFVQEVYSDLYEIAKVAALEGQGQLGISSDEQLQEIAKKYATTRINEMVGEGTRYSIADTTKEDLKAIIEKGLDEQLTSTELANEVQASSTFSRTRADLIADTETVMAQVHSHLEIWKASGKVKTVSIVLSSDHTVIDDCDDIAKGSPYKIEQCPTIPLHPNCKCSVVVEELN